MLCRLNGLLGVGVILLLAAGGCPRPESSEALQQVRAVLPVAAPNPGVPVEVNVARVEQLVGCWGRHVRDGEARTTWSLRVEPDGRFELGWEVDWGLFGGVLIQEGTIDLEPGGAVLRIAGVRQTAFPAANLGVRRTVDLRLPVVAGRLDDRLGLRFGGGGEDGWLLLQTVPCAAP